MTTVAYRDGLMASDSSALVHETHVHPARKIWRVGGGLVGMAGSLVHMPAFVRWLAEGADVGEYPDGDFDAIVVDPSGRVSMYEGAGPEPIVVREKYVAIGSGAPVALGALAAGADARAAVKAAIKHTTGSKAPVRSLRLRRA